MKRLLFIPIVCSVFLCGCVPVLFSYKHVVVAESDAVRVVARSTESNDSQGRPLLRGKFGLPTRSILSRSGYRVTLCTPLNSAPIVLLVAKDRNQKPLDLRGVYLVRLEEKRRANLNGDGYLFLVQAAMGHPIEFDVVTKQGVILGHEEIKYEVLSRGYVWDVDAL